MRSRYKVNDQDKYPIRVIVYEHDGYSNSEYFRYWDSAMTWANKQSYKKDVAYCVVQNLLNKKKIAVRRGRLGY